MNEIERMSREYESFLKSIDEIELQRKIRKFRELKFKDLSYADISNAIDEVLLHNGGFHHVPHIGKYPKGTKFYWVRLLDDFKVPSDKFNSLTDFWNPPAKYMAADKYGRLNKPKESLLYTTPLDPFVAIIEMGVDVDLPFALIVYESISEVKVNIIGGQFNHAYFGVTDKKAILVGEMFCDFLSDAFMRDVGRSKDGSSTGLEFWYQVSECIAKNLYDLPPRVFQDAWAYPSVHDKLRWNVCFRPDIAKDLLLLHGAIFSTLTKPYEIKPKVFLQFDTASDEVKYYAAHHEIIKSLLPDYLQFTPNF